MRLLIDWSPVLKQIDEVRMVLNELERAVRSVGGSGAVARHLRSIAGRGVLEMRVLK